MKRTINLQKLDDGLLGLHKINTSHLGLSAAYMLERNNLTTGVNIGISGIISDETSINWEYDINEEVLSSYEPRTATDKGAVGLSLLFVDEYLDYNVARVSFIDGQGFDYWLEKKGVDSLVFQESTRLEVSGIGKETKTNSIRARGKSKERRFEEKSIVKKAYISIAEFGTPKLNFYLYERN